MEQDHGGKFCITLLVARLGFHMGVILALHATKHDHN